MLCASLASGDRLSRGQKLAGQRRPVLLNRHAGRGDRRQHRLHAEHDRQSFAGDQIAVRAAVAERDFDIEQVCIWVRRQHLG